MIFYTLFGYCKILYYPREHFYLETKRDADAAKVSTVWI